MGLIFGSLDDSEIENPTETVHATRVDWIRSIQKKADRALARTQVIGENLAAVIAFLNLDQKDGITPEATDWRQEAEQLQGDLGAAIALIARWMGARKGISDPELRSLFDRSRELINAYEGGRPLADTAARAVQELANAGQRISDLERDLDAARTRAIKLESELVRLRNNRPSPPVLGGMCPDCAQAIALDGSCACGVES